MPKRIKPKPAMKIPNDLQFVVLATLESARIELPGREIARRVEAVAGQRVVYASLYVLLQRLREQGWVTQGVRQAKDGRVRYFRLTDAAPAAIRAARAYHQRLASLGRSPSASF